MGWFALALQWHLTHARVAADGRSWIVALAVFLAYFTILTNILAATCLTTLFLAREVSARLTRFASAVAVYIAVVGITYSLLLRRIWSPQGPQKLADLLLHDAMPLLFILYWLVLIPKGRLRWTSPLMWLIYPLAYLAVVPLRGLYGAPYPYPFLDVAALGYGRVLFHSLGLALAFLVLALILVGVDKLFASKA